MHGPRAEAVDDASIYLEQVVTSRAHHCMQLVNYTAAGTSAAGRVSPRGRHHSFEKLAGVNESTTTFPACSHFGDDLYKYSQQFSLLATSLPILIIPHSQHSQPFQLQHYHISQPLSTFYPETNQHAY